MGSYATSTTTQKDQRTMAEQAENLAGAGAVIAEPSSIVVGAGGSVGDITFSVAEKSEEKDGINAQLAEIIRSSLAQSPITPAAPDIPQIPQAQTQVAGINTKILLVAGIGIAAIMILKGKR